MSVVFQEKTDSATTIPFRLLFWNMGLSASLSLVGTLALEYKPDVIILVESKHGIATTVEKLTVDTGVPYAIPFRLPDSIQFLVRMPPERVIPLYDGGNMSIKHVEPVLGQSFMLVAVHLPSKLHLDREDQAVLCSRWVRHVREAETKIGHLRTVIIGDLNMNPFEARMVGSEGFHALSSRAIAARETRTVLNEERLLFYNPMWSTMGDAVGTPGTYYYSSSDPITYFWHTFDQMLLRPELARHFEPGDIVIASSIGGESLLGSGGIPNKRISDHLPIIGTIRLEV
jgi:hypothetical protein